MKIYQNNKFHSNLYFRINKDNDRYATLKNDSVYYSNTTTSGSEYVSDMERNQRFLLNETSIPTISSLQPPQSKIIPITISNFPTSKSWHSIYNTKDQQPNTSKTYNINSNGKRFKPLSSRHVYSSQAKMNQHENHEDEYEKWMGNKPIELSHFEKHDKVRLKITG